MPKSPELLERMRRYTNQRYHQRRRWIGFYKVLKGCEMCGFNDHPFALDFDHIDPSTKSFLIPPNINRNLKSLMAEIRKCRVLCANCHRIISFTKNTNALQVQYEPPIPLEVFRRHLPSEVRP